MSPQIVAENAEEIRGSCLNRTLDAVIPEQYGVYTVTAKTQDSKAGGISVLMRNADARVS